MAKRNKSTSKYPTKSSSGSLVKEVEGKYIVKGNSNAIKSRNTAGPLTVSIKNSPAILSGTAVKSESHMTYFEKMEAVKDGISKEDLEKLKAKAHIDYDKLAQALSVTRATLIKKKKQEKFNAVLSERILSLADLYSYGYEVFEDEDSFNRWMFRPNQALGGKIPFELISNQFGREEIKNIIGRIEYGVYS
jgi:putative toxin-antitoxin system antitoxin component (TIGR02293 family)